MDFERSVLSGEIVETKTARIDGVQVGIVTGHIAAWRPDSHPGIFGVPDRIVRGAYIESIQEHKARNNRKVRMKYEHNHLIGGFPIDNVREDNIGLYAEGHINLDTQLGVDTYSFAKQKVLVDFSVGHIVQSDEVINGERVIKKARLIEGSIVGEPQNRRAQIAEVKSIHFPDLPLASANYHWNEKEAHERVMELKFSQGNGADAFIGEHMIADVIDEQLFAVPAAIKLAASNIDQEDKTGQTIIERYFAKMEEPSPFTNKTFYTVDDVKGWSNAEFKAALIDTGRFSNAAIRALVARSKEQATVPESNQVALGSLLENINATTNRLS
jgi:HK97 family phage prohead protease